MIWIIIIFVGLVLFFRRKNAEYKAFERLLKLNGYSKSDFGDRRWIKETKTELRYRTFNEYYYIYNKKTKIGVITDEDFDGCCSTGHKIGFKYDDDKKVMVGLKKKK